MKENKIEKLILDLSNRWECTPQEAVDRLNSMNEFEINKLIESMVKKFQGGGRTWPIQKYETPISNDEYYSYEEMIVEPFDWRNRETIEEVTTPNKYIRRVIKPKYPAIPALSGRDTSIVRAAVDPAGNIGDNMLFIKSPHQGTGYNVVTPEQWKQLNDAIDERRNVAISFKNGGMIDCLRAGGNLTECKKCGGKAPIKAVGGSIPSKRYANRFEDLKKNQNSSTSDTTKKKEIVRIPGLHKQLGPTIPPLSKPNKKK